MDWIYVFQSSSKMVDSIVKALADIKTMFEQHWCQWRLVIQKCVESLFILIYLRILFLRLDCVHQYTMSDHYFPEKQKSLATISNLISCICYLYLPGEVFCTQDLYKFIWYREFIKWHFTSFFFQNGTGIIFVLGTIEVHVFKWDMCFDYFNKSEKSKKCVKG